MADVLLAFERDGGFLQALDHRIHRPVDPALERHWIAAGRDVPQTIPHDRPGQNRRGGGAVARGVVGLAGHFFDQLGPHVLHGVLEFDFFGDGDAVFCNGRRPPLPLQDNIAPLRPQGDAHRAGYFLYAPLERSPRFFIV